MAGAQASTLLPKSWQSCRHKMPNLATTADGRTLVKPHWSFWLIGVVALIWNGLGVLNFFMQFNPEAMEMMPEWWHAVIENRPMWAMLSMVVAVFGGAFGAILLLVRKRWALQVFMASLTGVVLTMVHSLSVVGPMVEVGFRQVFEAVVMSIVVGVFLIWYTHFAKGRSWLI